MSRKTKIATLFLVLVCVISQIALFASAATENSYSYTLPNMQSKVTIGTGTNASADPARTYMSFTGGTANKISVQTQRSSNSAAITNWYEFSQSTSYQSLWYNTTINAGTGLKVVAYQKNVASKTASGYIYY